MIYLVVSADNDQTLKSFIKHWAPKLGRHLQIIHVQQLANAGSLPVGTYVFTDLDRQAPLQLALQQQVYSQLKSSGSFRLLNQPDRVLTRFKLLRALHETGVNSFRVFRIHEVPEDVRFPVFIRRERDHKGTMTPLIENWADLEDTAIRLGLEGADASDLLVVEYCEARRPDGLYAMYSCYKVDDRIVPRHVYFNSDWLIKGPDISPEWRMEEKWDYLRTNPHADELLGIFNFAKVDYGRIDYALVDGKIEVWEINLNPGYSAGPADIYPLAHREMHQWGADLVAEALIALDIDGKGLRVPIQFSWNAALESLHHSRS